MKRGMEPFLVLNRTICSKSVGYFLTFFFFTTSLWLPCFSIPHQTRRHIAH